MKNASTHNFVIYYPISMNKKMKDMVFQALQNSHNSYFYIKCVKRVFFVHEKVFYAETKVEAV
jgi:hypothetical protein